MGRLWLVVEWVGVWLPFVGVWQPFIGVWLLLPCVLLPSLMGVWLPCVGVDIPDASS